MSYRIKRVAHITGINPATLRAWERRYNVIAPQRTGSGYRLYSDDDVAMLARIKGLTDQGLTIGEAIARVRRGAAPVPVPADASGLAEVRAELRQALLAFDRAAAQAAYDRTTGLSPTCRAEEVLLPVMREVGALWEGEEAVVAQEHFASAFVREKLAALMADTHAGAAAGPEGVCAGAPGDPHELGLMAAAVRLASGGWRVLYLGADTPLDDLRRVLCERRPRLLCTSVVLRRGWAAFHELAQALRALAPRDTAVVIGGGGVPTAADEIPGVRYASAVADVLGAA